MPERCALEMRKVAGQFPGQGVISPNDTILCVGDDQRELHALEGLC
jgi:hypothetical protein